MTKDYGIDLNCSIILHADESVDFGMSLNDSDGLHFDRKYENIATTSVDGLSMLLSGLINDIENAFIEHQEAKAAKEEQAKTDSIKDEFVRKNEELNKLYEMYSNVLDEKRKLEEEVESYRIDNEILRMRNDKFVNDAANKTKKKEQPNTVKPKTKKATTDFDKTFDEYMDLMDKCSKFFMYKI